MAFVPMANLLAHARAGGYAVPSFCCWNAEVMRTVLATADRLRSPVIIMNGWAEYGLLVPADLGRIAHALLGDYPWPVALHLDHGQDFAQVEQCLAAGYTSVMLDYSSRPFAENAAALRKVVEMARPHGATVEGELGMVGKTDDPSVSVEGAVASTLTDPDQAAEYVAATGVDALAVSIGNAHGRYAGLPQLDFDLLARLRRAVSVPLVLHGGTGTPEADLRRAISLGVAKVNVATDLIAGVRESLLAQWQAGRNLWTPMALAEAMQSVAIAVERWIGLLGSGGRA